MKKNILKIFTLAALVAAPLCISLSSCSSDDSDEVTPLAQQDSVIVTTLAGSTEEGYVDGTGSAAQFFDPFGIVIDASGNLYVADGWNHRIRKVTPEGEVTTLAGSTEGYADGTGSAAQFRNPYGIAIDASGNLYVADEGNNCIRKVTPYGKVTTLAGSTQGYADGKGSAAQFYSPGGIAIDASGNLYVADGWNHRIRKVTPEGEVTTLAGNTQGHADGKGDAAKFYFPYGIAINASGNLYVTDSRNNRIRKVTPKGEVSTLAGSSWGYADGKGSAARFRNPYGIAIDALGNLYVTDTYNYRIRKVTPDGVVTTLAGNGSRGYADGIGSDARFAIPTGIAIDASGSLYVADWGNNCIRKIEFKKENK